MNHEQYDGCKPDEKDPEIASFCADCGTNVNVDEDGCCATCGAGAMGEGVVALNAEIALLKAQLQEMKAVNQILWLELTKNQKHQLEIKFGLTEP